MAEYPASGALPSFNPRGYHNWISLDLDSGQIDIIFHFAGIPAKFLEAYHNHQFQVLVELGVILLIVYSGLALI